MPIRQSAAIIPFVVALAATPLIPSTTFGAEELKNPLTPSYFIARSNADSANASGTQHVDRHNPLHPTYFAPERWLETGVHNSTPSYSDPNNPLHPGFRKS
jgi:hypothetical protein